MIAKQYTHHIESNEVKSVAGFAIGLRELDVLLDLKLDTYALNFINCQEDAGKVIFLLENQMVKGKVKLHIDRDIEMIVKIGTLVNKDYIIDFSFLIHKLIVEVKFKANKDGTPDIELKVSLEDLQLTNDLKFDIENGDLITDVISYLKDLWLPQVESIVLKDLFPKINSEVGGIINQQIAENFKKKINFDDKLKLQIDVTCHDLSVHNDYLIATIDGHINNYENPRNMDEVAFPTYDMPQIDTSMLQPQEIALQLSYDNIYTMIYAALQNKIDFQIDVDKAICNSITIFREPNYSAVITLLRATEDEGGKDIGLHIGTEMFLKVKVNLNGLPDFDIKVKVKADIIDVKMLGDKGTADASFLNIKVTNTEVLTLFDDNMNSVVELHKNGAVYNKIRNFMADNNITKEIAINKIAMGEHGNMLIKRIIPCNGYAIFTADITA